MAIPGSLLQTSPGDEAGRTWGYPRTAFTYMARDQHTAHGVIEMEAALTQQVCWPIFADKNCCQCNSTQYLVGSKAFCQLFVRVLASVAAP